MEWQELHLVGKSRWQWCHRVLGGVGKVVGAAKLLRLFKGKSKTIQFMEQPKGIESKHLKKNQWVGMMLMMMMMVSIFNDIDDEGLSSKSYLPSLITPQYPSNSQMQSVVHTSALDSWVVNGVHNMEYLSLIPGRAQ